MGCGMPVAEDGLHPFGGSPMMMFDRTQIYVSVAFLAFLEIAAAVVSAATR
jgi:hypothetical protein